MSKERQAPGSEPADAPSKATAGERIAKRIARAGICSRRDAEKLIAAGRVAVNGTVLTTPAVTVTEADRITVDGKPLAEPEPTRLWRYHKPRGLMTTNRDPEGRRTIFDELPPDLPRVVTVGRLDMNSEGLLLLTNDGELARSLELPSRGWIRRYRVRVYGHVDPARLATLAEGVTVGEERYGPIQATLDQQKGDNAWLTVALREGRNREVRVVMEHLGYEVSRLIRVAYGPFQLGHLERGEVDEVRGKVLRDQLGVAAQPVGDDRAGRRAGRPRPSGSRGAAISSEAAKPVGRKAKPRARSFSPDEAGSGRRSGGGPRSGAGKPGPRRPAGR